MVKNLTTFMFSLLLFISCGTQKKVDRLMQDSISAEISIPDSDVSDSLQFDIAKADTIVVHDADDNEILIMNAVKDEDGEMVATDFIEASRVVARFRNVAERHGKVDLQFDIIVPERLQDSKWQLRFYPEMVVLGDSVSLDPVIVTGRDYRRAQLRGYQQYERFLRSLDTDPDRLMDDYQLEIFLKRNLPQIYALKTDTTYVSDERFSSLFGVSEKDAIDHYTNHLRLRYNDYRRSLTDKKFRRFVKVPIENEGLRLDTVMQAVNGDFIYKYTQTVMTRPKLRRVDISLAGSIYEQDNRIYTIPQTGPLTYYISSISAFADLSERYLSEVIERSVEANTACYIDFAQGSHDVNLSLSDNMAEISRIQDNLLSLLQNETYELDSIVVTASASPEGRFSANDALSQKRSEAVSRYFGAYLKRVRDSLSSAEGLRISLDEEFRSTEKSLDLRFVSRNNPENWNMLDAIVESDDEIDEAQKEEYRKLKPVSDPDVREKMMQSYPWYPYFRQNLYPRLRTVCFDFHLHRKGMVKDTVHTTVLDSTYMRGVQAIRDMDYETAVTLLRPYADYNTAVAYCCMDYNESALSILSSLERNARVNYMLAVVYARKGRISDAVQSYLDACAQDASYVHRGNLDPEVSSLIREYGLNRQDLP